MGFLTKLWYKYLGGRKTPWADVSVDPVTQQMVARDWNDQYIEALRERLGGELTENKNPAQIVQLHFDRNNIEREEPKLDVLHMGIDTDGGIKMQLDWNKAFIKHLAEHGITGETDEQAIQLYLSMLTHQAASDMQEGVEPLTREQLNMAFDDIDKETAAELEQAARTIDEFERGRQKRKPRARRGYK